MNKDFLYASKGNAKLNKRTLIFDLSAGRTCPGAKDCKAMVSEQGFLIQGKDAKFRCYAATSELRAPKLKACRTHNLNMVKGKTIITMAKIIKASILYYLETNKDIELIRLHSSGDFFSQSYFDAWVKVANEMPNLKFYTYTKSLPFWVKRINDIPANMYLTASKGGKFDNLISEYNLKFAEVVLSQEEAKAKGLETDHDDSHAFGDKSFAIIVHGTQPAGSKYMEAVMQLRKNGIFGYDRKKTKVPA